MNSIAFRILFLKEVKRFLRVIGQTLLAPMVNSVLYLLIFGVSIGRHVEVGAGVSYLFYLIPGLLMMGVLNNSFTNSASSLMISKYHGDLEDLKITPLSGHEILWAISMASLCRGLIVGATILFTGEIFAYLQMNELVTIAHPAWALFFMIIGGLAFGQLGIVVGFVSRTFDHMNTFTSFILLPLIYLGGVFFSLNNLHPFWQAISLGNPLLYYINGVRFSFIDYSDVPVWTCAGVALTFLLVTTTAAYLAVRKGAYQRF